MRVPRIRFWICTLSMLMLFLKQGVKVCEATLCSPPCLLVSNTSDIVTVDYKTAAVSPVISGLTRAVAIDVHFSSGYIFWSDVSELNIKRFQIGGSITTIISGIGVCDGLAVDWRSNELYWTDATYDTISKSDLNGYNQQTVISLSLDEPRAIAIDPDSSLMFWTDWGSSEKIEKASLSGSQRVAIVTTFLYFPNGIELDRGNKRIYWVDAGYDRVESVDYNGNNRKQIFQQSGLHPFGVTLIPPFLYFTDWNTQKEVHKLDATTGAVISSYSINGGEPMGIVAYDYARQPPASSPCAQNNGGCSHFCVAKTSGYECVCPVGLTVMQDGKTCNDKPTKFIMFTDADGMSTNYISLDVDDFISQKLFNHLGNQRPIALDYDPIEDRVYWSDTAHGRIFSAFFNASSLRTLFHCNVQTPDGLAIDYVGRNIYWTDTGTNRIEVGTLDGAKRNVLFKDGLDEPRAIVLDGRNGMMYWSDWGASPKIERAGMDGSARQTIITGNLGWPNGLTIDQASNRLYWADAKLDKIEVSDLDGGNRQNFISYAPDIHPYGLALHQNVFYWTDWNFNGIVRYNVGSGSTTVELSGLQKPMDIHVFDSSLIFSGPHNCSQNNGLCSDFCLLKPGGYQCACPTGISLMSDGKTCDHGTFQKQSSEKFMLYAEAYVGRIDKVPLTVPGTPCFPLGITTNISNPVAVDYDPIEGKIYWTDVSLKLLARAFPNGSSAEVIAHNNVDTPDGLAVDYIGRNLYWTDKGTSKIEVARLDGSSRRTLITSSVDHPRAILLDIAERKMYWSDWGSVPMIVKANMDGSARTTLVSSGLTWVNSLALDYQNKYLYWCDGYHDKIERVDLQGNNRLVILDLSTGNMHPFGLALADNVLYWTDWNNRSLHKYDMTTSVNKVMIRGIGKPMELHIHDDSKIYSGTTSCSNFNGGCSHLCLPNPSGHQCFCPEGVQLKPGDAYTCQGVNRCPQLSAPVQGSMQPCTNLPGQTCLFSCDPGHVMTGSISRTCNSDGTWTGTQTQCNAPTCPALPAPSNGVRQGCTGTITENYDTICQFSCNPGFNAFGSPTRKCLQNGTWSGQDFKCQAVDCGPLSTPSKAILMNPSCGTTYGSNCVFACQIGYGSSVGNVLRTCLQTGLWSGNDINCTDIRPPSFGVTCPSSPLVAYAEQGLLSAQVTWTVPVATDNSGVSPTVTSNYQPPQRLGQGSHVIVYTAVDQSGNKGTCNLTIEVIVITCTSLTVNSGGPLRISNCGNHYGAHCNFSCNIGYRLNGSSTLTCVAPGNQPPASWDNPVPSCQVITCPTLSVPPNAVLHNPSCGNTYGSSCVFGCQSGYGSSSGDVTRTCLQSEQWGGSPITCTDILPPSFGVTCPSSPLVVYAERGLFSTQVNWTEPIATDNSRVPPTVTSNYQPLQRFDQGSHVITYTAVDQSGNSVTCRFTIEVTVINCTTLTVNPGGHLRMSSCANHYGAQCNFSCSIGYRLNGSSTVTCVAPGNKPPGNWDNPVPGCDAITCPALPAPTYGYRQGCSGSTIEYYNMTCQFSCNSGFNGYGTSSRTCQQDGTWSGKTFLCLAHSCGPIDIPPNAFLFNTSCGNLYGASCTFGCRSGFLSTNGNVTRTCQHSGQWSGNPINCTDILPPTFGATCPSSPLLVYAERGLFSAQVNWNEPVATDNSGVPPTVTSNYKPLQRLSQGSHVITYTAVDQSGNNATCSFTITVTVIYCTSLTVNPGGPLLMGSCANHYGAQCNFSCAIGYHLNGSSTVTCDAHGNKPPANWDNPLPRCEAITCPALSTPSNGARLVCSGTTKEYYNTVCHFSCNPGYNGHGSPLRTCQENGTWSGQNFNCQVVTCATLSIPPKATLLTPSCGKTYTSSCVFGCKSGYGSTSGVAVPRTCLHTGQWSGNPINCTDILSPTFGVTCPSSPLVVYAERGLFSAQVNWTEPVSTDNSGVPPTVTSNYQPLQRFDQGTYVIVYTAVDQSGNKGNCSFTVKVIVINCNPMTVTPGGPLLMDSCANHYGAQCNFSCSIGYRLNGLSSITCDAPGNKPPGSWDNPLPICQVKRCPSLPIPSNGYKDNCTDLVSEPYDTRCSFSCNVGYNLIGSSVRRCLENETWSGVTTRCQIVTCPAIPAPTNGAKAGCTNMASESYDTQCSFSCNKDHYLIGSSVRRCLENGTWSGDMPFCQASLCDPPCLLMSNTTDILAVDYKTSAVRSIVSGLTRAVAIDVHFSSGYIFWSDVTERNIKRFRIDQASITTIITGIGVCDGLAVDWRSSKLYWTDTTNDTISISDLEGNNQRTLLSLGFDEPRGITLDLDNGYMFWTDWGISPKLERAALDGTQRVAIVTANLHWPNGIDLDKGNKRIYWVDAHVSDYDKVESVDYNGNNRKLLFKQKGLHPFDVALIPPFLFFTDWNAMVEVHQLDATTGKVLHSYGIGGGKPMGIVAYDSFRQPSAPNSCAVNNGGCSHFCVPKASGYQCVCPTGLTVKQDGKTCEDKAKKFILFADADDKSTNYISLDVDYFVAQSLFNHRGNQRPIALDYDPVGDRVYWSDSAQGRIISAFFNATLPKTLFRCNVKTPEGLAIDHVGRNIYWTDTGTNRIEVGTLDGTKRKLLIKDGLDEPRAIVLDGRNGMMYWSDWGANPKIERAGMDGSARQTIVTVNLGWPNGLTIDQATNRLYWADAKLDKIEVSDLDGRNRQLILSSAANIHPYGLAVYQNALYWTDWNKKSISRYNLSSGIQDMIVTGLQKPMDIHVFDPSLIFSGPHSCSQNNGLCSDFCLLKPGGYQCACPTGVALKSDGKTCDYDLFSKKSSEEFMIFAEAETKEIYQVPLAVPGTPCSPLKIATNISRPVAVDYDPIEGKIYWTDVTLKLLARAFPNGSSVEVIAHNNVTTPDGIAVDYIGRVLYWTDMGTSKIEVAKLDGSLRKSLITSIIDRPRAIILDIAESKMYWSDWGSSPKIEQANMDGSARKVLVSSGLNQVNSLALDYQNRLLYWCDAYLDKIERVDLQGNNRKLILDLSLGNMHPFGLGLSGDVLYWTDWNTKSVHKYNMTSSKLEVLVHGMGRPMEIHIHDHTDIVNGSTSCSQFNGGCSHLCLPNPSGHQCFCPEGVQLKPNDGFTCQGVNRCPQLSAPVQGSMQPCTNLPGQTCQFSCNIGHVLTGSTTRTCNSNGAWTGTQTQCNVVTCSALPIPSNGKRVGCTGMSTENYNTTCQFSCYSGYTEFGSSSRRCQANGTWSGQNFFCQAVDCPPLSVPPRAVLLTPSCGAKYGSNCVFGCQRGYSSADGNVTRTCLDSGQWGGNTINCTDMSPPTFGVTCPSSPLIAYAERSLFSAQVTWTEPVATDNLGGTPTVTSNYKPPKRFTQGTHVITYTAKDQSGNEAKCTFAVKVIVINCTSLTVNPGGPLRMSSCANHYGAKCNFSCAIGFRLNGSSTVTCVAPGNKPPGNWDNPLPRCEAITCPYLPVPTNGIKTGCPGIVTEPYDTHCSFSCNAGYNLIGSSVRRCLENETWSGETSHCQAITCGPLVPPNDVVLSPSSCLSSSLFSQTCIFTCQKPGYVLEGSSSRVCGNDGQWTGSNDTQCRDNTRPSFNDTCPNNMVIYTPECSSSAMVTWNKPVATDNSGHVTISYPVIRPPVNLSIGLYNVLYSATDGSGNRANCTFIVQVARKSCPVLQPPVHGSIASFSCGSAFGSQASLACNIGHQMTGSSKRTCQSDGTWSGTTTVCNVVKCPGIVTSSHVLVSPSKCKIPSGVDYQTSCIFKCNITVGYQMNGAAQVSCLESGSWSADPTKTTCTDIQAPSITCPPDMDNIPTEPGQSYASVTWKVPIPTDNSNEPLDLSGPQPPQKINVGKKYITYKVTDSSGLSTSCSFSVNVIDLEPPKFVSCPKDIHITSEKKWNKIYFPAATVTDNVGVHSVTSNRVNGSKVTWGEHNITYTALDNSQNVAKCHFLIIIVGETCDPLPSPLNGAKACDKWLDGGTFCTLFCNSEYDFASKPAEWYYCIGKGEWWPHDNVPDCSKARKAKTLLASQLHYLAEQCTEEMHAQIASNFMALYTRYLGTAGGCDGMEECSVTNVDVECGEINERRRRRDLSSKVPITVKYSVEVPLPSNTSQADLNQTTQQLSDDILAVLNKTDLNLNIDGIVLEYDASKPPVFRFVGLVCDKGQVLRGTKCVNCPVGYFFNTTSCQACAVDHYQDQEAQASCMPCPSGTSTFEKTGSKWSKDCQEIPSSSSTEGHGLSKTVLYPVVGVVVCLVLTALVAGAVFFWRKRSIAKRRPKTNARSQTFTGEENMGHTNPVYDDTASIQDNEPQYMEIGEVQQRNVRDYGFQNPHFERGNHYEALDNAHERPVYMGLDHAQTGQTDV